MNHRQELECHAEAEGSWKGLSQGNVVRRQWSLYPVATVV